MDIQQRCPNCGFPVGPDDKLCRNCGMPLSEKREEKPFIPPQTPPIPPVPPPPIPPGSQPPPSDEPKYVAWEDRQHLGFFGGLWKTWVDSVFSPDKFFSKLPFSGGLGSPILYALIIVWIATVVDSFYNMVFSNFWLGVFSSYVSRFSEFKDLGIGTGFTILSFFINVMVAPAVILLGIFIISGIYHLLAMIFGWAKRDFEATLRAVAYSAGPAIFAIVPFCGSPIGWIWAIVMTIIGLKHMQQTTGGKAALVVLLPLILCCCLIAFIISIIFWAAIAAFIQGASSSRSL